MLTRRDATHVEPRAFIRRMLRDVDRFFEDGWAFPVPPRALGELAWVPTLEVVEKDRNLIVRLDLPGVKKEEVTVTLTDEGLTIEGERKVEEETKKKDWYRTERAYGQFIRTVPLPEGVDPAAVKAAFENGVLEVTVPLPAQAAATVPRTIEIGAGDTKRGKAAA